ncbi:formyltetrahydrofolate deformylase [Flavobacteriales bacterium]|nr:formyltetrahydrofolate deformylase [Flavobacteriales bacterium]
MKNMKDSHGCRLIVDCPDKRGVVAKVSASLSNLGATILEAHQHSDVASGHFFMRYEVEQDAGATSMAWSAATLRDGLSEVSEELGLNVRVSSMAEKPKVALLATKASHCLVDVLQRWRSGELHCDIACVIANHPEMGEYAAWYKVPFHHVDFTHQPKDLAFEKVDALLDEHQVDLTVLARFMQIIPANMIAKRRGRMINIHHSFLPSFVGARPYDQAFERGVKLIGATCHYVTEELDEGPIIEQEVIRVSHTDTPADLRRKGRMCEREALGRGLRLHLEDRVFIHGNKTVVFSD